MIDISILSSFYIKDKIKRVNMMYFILITLTASLTKPIKKEGETTLRLLTKCISTN